MLKSNIFKYRVIIRTSESNWILFDDVLDIINAEAIADEAIDGWKVDNNPIVEAKVLEKATNEYVYEASK